MPNVHVIIPNYNHYHLINELLFSLYKHERENIESITIVDDCSTDEEVFTGLNWWDTNGMLPITLSTTDENLGFLKTSNLELRKICEHSNCSPTDIVILIGTDVKIYGKFISQIIHQLTQCQKSLVGGILYTHDTGWNKFGEKIFPYIDGWLLTTTVGNWVELDYFDERFAPWDFEDVDLSTKALELGYILHPLNSSMLKHLGGQSIGFNKKRLEQTKINQKKFGDKWINCQR